MEFVLFSNKQGSGYFSLLDNEIDNEINKVDISINNQKIKVGEFINLDNFFCRDLQYLGINKKNNSEMIFFIGATNNLFEEVYYYQSIFKISESRIFELTGQGSGRDYNFIGGKWK